MTPEKFLALPTAEQLLAIYEVVSADKQPTAPSGNGTPPKFDTMINRGQGKVTWASECSLKELLYQKERADTPPRDPKYLESNQKQSKRLSYWVSFRQSNPTDVWSGERNRVSVTAMPPTDKPALYDKDAPPPDRSFSNDAGGGDDDIPFSPIRKDLP